MCIRDRYWGCFLFCFYGAISSIGLLFFFGGWCRLALVHKYLHIRILGPGTSKLSCTHGLYDQSPVQASLGPKSMTALSKVWPSDLCMVMAQQSPSCRWWSQVGGVLQKKKEHTEDTTSHGEKKKEKKKGKKKKNVPCTGIELANFDLIIWWFHPLRHSGMNWEKAFNFSKLTPTRRSLVPHTKTKTIFPH